MAEKYVVAIAAVQDIVSLEGGVDIAGIAIHHVVSIPAEQCVISCPAAQRVVTGAAGKGVGAAATIEAVIAVSTIQRVVAGHIGWSLVITPVV